MNTKDRARALMMRRHHTIKHRQQTMLYRAGANMGLSANAIDNCSRIQGKLDPAISAACRPSGVAMS